jgi:hypothetical protein
MKAGDTLEVRACIKEAMKELSCVADSNWTDPCRPYHHSNKNRTITIRTGNTFEVAELANQKLRDAGFDNLVYVSGDYNSYIKVTAYLPFTVTVDKNGLMHS